MLRTLHLCPPAVGNDLDQRVAAKSLVGLAKTGAAGLYSVSRCIHYVAVQTYRNSVGTVLADADKGLDEHREIIDVEVNDSSDDSRDRNAINA